MKKDLFQDGLGQIFLLCIIGLLRDRPCGRAQF